jgi:hypothetical protein
VTIRETSRKRTRRIDRAPGRTDPLPVPGDLLLSSSAGHPRGPRAACRATPRTSGWRAEYPYLVASDLVGMKPVQVHNGGYSRAACRVPAPSFMTAAGMPSVPTAGRRNEHRGARVRVAWTPWAAMSVTGFAARRLSRSRRMACGADRVGELAAEPGVLVGECLVALQGSGEPGAQ